MYVCVYIYIYIYVYTHILIMIIIPELRGDGEDDERRAVPSGWFRNMANSVSSGAEVTNVLF